MKGKRSKQYRKLMHAYNLTFAFREPYQVLVDSGMIRDAAKFKMQLGRMLSNTLHGEIKPMITQCCIRHLYEAPTTTDDEKREKNAWIEVAKQAERRRCGHHELPEALSERECILSVVDPKGSGTNRHRYVVASQEMETRRALRAVVGVPLVYINRSVMILEPMAGKSEEVREAEERGKRRAGLIGRRGAGGDETSAGEKRKRDDDEGEEEEGQGEAQQKKKKPRGPKGPNPLSVKKAKKDKPQQGQGQKSAAKQTEGERATKREAATTTADNGQDAAAAAPTGVSDGVNEGTRKRKRKRKPKTDGGDGGTEETKDHDVGGVSLTA